MDANAQAVWVVNHLDDKVYEIDPHTTRSFASRRSARRRTSPSTRAPRGSRRPCRSPCSPLVYGGGGVPDLEIASDPTAGAESRSNRRWWRRSPSFSTAAVQSGKPQRRLPLVRRLDRTVGRIRFRDVRHEREGVLREPRARRRDWCLRQFLQRHRNPRNEPRARPVTMISPSSTYLDLTAAAPARPGEMRFRCPTGHATSSGSSPPTTCRHSAATRRAARVEAGLRARGRAERRIRLLRASCAELAVRVAGGDRRSRAESRPAR